MARYSSDSDSDSGRKRSSKKGKKKTRSRKRSRSSSSDRQRSRDSRRRSRSRSRDSRRRSISRSRSRSDDSYYSRRKRSTSRSRGRRSRSRSSSRERYSRRRRSRSRSREKSRKRGERSRNRSHSRERSVPKKKSQPPKPTVVKQKDPCEDIPGFAEMTPAQQNRLRMQAAFKALDTEKVVETTAVPTPAAAETTLEHMERAQVIADIEDEGFMPTHFSSTRSTKTAEPPKTSWPTSVLNEKVRFPPYCVIYKPSTENKRGCFRRPGRELVHHLKRRQSCASQMSHDGDGNPPQDRRPVFVKVPSLEALPNSPGVQKIYNHWERQLRSYIAAATGIDNAADKLAILCSFISADVYALIEDKTTYADAIKHLSDLFKPKKNEVFTRHLLSTRSQQSNENVQEFYQNLLLLSKDCDFKAVDAETYKQESVRDAFIRGLRSSNIRTRLLEQDELTLEKALLTATSLEKAREFSSTYDHASAGADTLASASNAILRSQNDHNSHNHATEQHLAVSSSFRYNRQRGERVIDNCKFCGESHIAKREACPAWSFQCPKCHKFGHFSRFCGNSRTSLPKTSSQISSLNGGAPLSLSNSTMVVRAGWDEFLALVDSGASESFVKSTIASKLKLVPSGPESKIKLASDKCFAKILGHVYTKLSINNKEYNVRLGVIDNLCADFVLGVDFMKLHQKVIFQFEGENDALTVCNLAVSNVEDPPRIFQYLNRECKPIAAPSRRYSKDDYTFICEEVERLAHEGIVEPSYSPWRAQPLVTKDPRHKRRLVIDYSQTINKYTNLDAYPLPRMEDVTNEVAKGRYFSAIDLKSAYHQVPLHPDDRPFTAFAAGGSLYQFCRLPFGVTNGVAAYQRYIHNFIKRFNLQGTVSYLDDITIYGQTKEEHDRRLQAFLDAARECKLTINEKKSKFGMTEINMLGNLISFGKIKPDPLHMAPLMEMAPPRDAKSLQRCSGMFSYYSKWIPNFSAKIRPLIKTSHFPLSREAITAFELLKRDLLKSSLGCIYNDEPFVIECDASNHTIAAILNQRSRPVAFFSRTLSKSELNYPSIEKEALSIIESVRKWNYLLAYQKFNLVTDQRALSFIFKKEHSSKIKNTKLALWRLELSAFNYEICHRPGTENIAPDTLSRICSIGDSATDLNQIHKELGHPGVRRLLHFIRSKNLPFSTEDARRVCLSCSICAEQKPRFCKSNSNNLIKAILPWQRISIDFKGPVSGKTKYLLVVVDEFSRFPFAFPCSNMKSETVIDCLCSLFSLFGLPEYVHSDRSMSFLSKSVNEFLVRKGVATSRTTPYHPTGNSQCERTNQTIWRTVKLILAERKLPESAWEMVLNDALHCIRSLLCTATNSTPHDRFFCFRRRCMNGSSVPDWLLQPGVVLLKKFVRDKSEPLCNKVDLISANTKYALIRDRGGRESTVSITDLAPYPNVEESESYIDDNIVCEDVPAISLSPNRVGENTSIVPPSVNEPSHNSENINEPTSPKSCENQQSDINCPIPRRSSRISKPPERYGVYITH